MDLNTLGMGLIAIGAILLAIGRIAQLFIRKVVDSNITDKEREANDAAKESAAKLSIYRDLKRKYDELRNRK